MTATRWLITGGCGFIGSALIRDLCASGGRQERHQIRVLDNLAVGRLERLEALAPVVNRSAEQCNEDSGADGGIEFVFADVLDRDAVRASARGRDVIVHLAANTGVAQSVEDPHNDCKINVVGTLNCLEAARESRARRFVFASSGAPLGAAEPPVSEQTAPRPASPYGASKLAGEGYCSAYWWTFGIETVALRFGNVYGPGSDDKSSVVAAFIKRAMAGQTLEIYGDGHQTRDFIFVDDLVRAVRLAARVPNIGGHVFQIASARETTIAEIARLLAPILGRAGLPDVKVNHAPPRLGDARRSYADTTKAASMLGWTVQVPLEDGLCRVVDWFVHHRGPRQPAS